MDLKFTLKKKKEISKHIYSIVSVGEKKESEVGAC
jgi:hypothetical protein